MRQADMSRAAAFGYLGPQVNLWPDRPPWIEHIAHLQQDQFSHADAGGVGEVQKHHVTLRHATGDGSDANSGA